MEIPKTHPRYGSLLLRERIATGVENGLVAPAGLAAHGRGEAFDYLLGEITSNEARKQARAAAAALLISRSPVISVNGNSTVLALNETMELALEINANIEVNLFHPSEERIERLVSLFEESGAMNVRGRERDSIIPGIEHNRGRCSRDGIFSADTVLVLLEDGDRTRALKQMGKYVIAVDLNPLSRTPRTCDIPVIDNITRALPEITAQVRRIRRLGEGQLKEIIEDFNARKSLGKVVSEITDRLNEEFSKTLDGSRE